MSSPFKELTSSLLHARIAWADLNNNISSWSVDGWLHLNDPGMNNIHVHLYMLIYNIKYKHIYCTYMYMYTCRSLHNCLNTCLLVLWLYFISNMHGCKSICIYMYMYIITVCFLHLFYLFFVDVSIHVCHLVWSLVSLVV